MLPVVLFATLIGTYLDLFFVGRGLYSFPNRPFPTIFSVNIAFTLIVLPLIVLLFLYICDKLTKRNTFIFILLIGLLASVLERIAEDLGLFIHSSSWNHIYSCVGYSLFMWFVYAFYQWMKKSLPKT
ncbi:CBO0543 family protein [Robertmurraya sp. Marseille-Q9965]